MSLTSICTSTQLSIALYRLGSSPEALRRLRELLGRKTDRHPGLYEPRSSQVYIWQVPSMLLNISIQLFILGLTVLIWTVAARVGWGDDMKVSCVSLKQCLGHA